MPRDKDTKTIKTSPQDELALDIEKLLESPPARIDDADDPVVRCQIGEWISVAANRPIAGRRRRRRRR